MHTLPLTQTNTTKENGIPRLAQMIDSGHGTNKISQILFVSRRRMDAAAVWMDQQRSRHAVPLQGPVANATTGAASGAAMQIDDIFERCAPHT